MAQQTNSQPVDVLAVIRRVAVFNGGYIADDLAKVESAVTELIRAVKAEREARAAVARENASLASGEITPEELHPGADAPDGISTSQRHIEAVQRVSRALARVQGGAA